VADGGDDSCLVLDATDLRLVKRIPLTPGVDAGVYDASSRRFYVGSSGKGTNKPTSIISIISSDQQKEVGRIRLDSTELEAMTIDHSKNRLYVNLRDRGEIGVVALDRGEVDAVWKSLNLNRNTAMALDEANGRLFVAGRSPGKLSVIDTRSGKIIRSLGCIESADDMSFDDVHHRIYVTGAGGISVINQTDPDHYKPLAEFGTMKGKTSIYIPSLQQFYIIHGASQEDGAGLQIYKVKY
jgi:hypothetical protein